LRERGVPEAERIKVAKAHVPEGCRSDHDRH
jgi:hypothetical protein